MCVDLEFPRRQWATRSDGRQRRGWCCFLPGSTSSRRCTSTERREAREDDDSTFHSHWTVPDRGWFPASRWFAQVTFAHSRLGRGDLIGKWLPSSWRGLYGVAPWVRAPILANRCGVDRRRRLGCHHAAWASGSVAPTPFQIVQAEQDFACQLRPLSGPTGDRNGEVAWSVDRTEFACSYRGRRCRFWADSIGGHQEYLIAPSDDQAAVVAALTSLLDWPSSLPAAIKRQDSGVLGVTRWHYPWSGYILIEVADSARVT